MDAGIILTCHDGRSEGQAYALAMSIKARNPTMPLLVVFIGYLSVLDWHGLGEVRVTRAAGGHGTDERWFNKLAALSESPFDETVYLDSDMVMLSDVGRWFGMLRTDDLTFWNVRLDPDSIPDRMEYNVVNPHRMKEHFGISRSPVIDGGGHYYFRRTARGEKLLQRIADIMEDALERGADSLYGRMTGAGNIPASDEPAASIMVVEEEVRLPEPIIGLERPLGIFMPPHQRDAVFDFDAGVAEYHDEWVGGRVRAGAVHFCAHGKLSPAYREWVDKQVASGHGQAWPR